MLPTLGLYGIQDAGDFETPCWTHDHNLALMEGGRVLWVLELERYTRLKHDNRLPLFIEQLVNDRTIPLPDKFRIVSVDSFAGRTFLSASGRWRIEGDLPPIAESPALQVARGRIGTSTVEAYHCFQELAHIASNLPFTGGFEEGSLLMHIDGGASQGNASAFHYLNGQFIHLYHGWDTVWPVLNFGSNNLTHSIVGLDSSARLAAPGQLMGFSSYGTDNPELRHWLRRHDWFRQHWENPKVFFDAARRDFKWSRETFDTRDPFLMNIAAACQAEFEETMLSLIEQMRDKTAAKHLYIAGGAMLNVELNRKLVESNLFDRIFIPPCCSDCGLGLGAAALAEYLEYGYVERHSPFLSNIGTTPSGTWGLALDMRDLAGRLERGQVVAVCTGAAEVGPRALGHRSLLTSPVELRFREHVSEQVKRRAWFRPIAPVILEELAEEVFPGSTRTSLTDFMLCNAKVAPAWRERIPAVVHVDGTARVQVVRRDAPDQDFLRALLWEVWNNYRIPCLVNTSFNGPNEPIVQSPEQARVSANKLGVDVLVIDDCMESYVAPELHR